MDSQHEWDQAHADAIALLRSLVDPSIDSVFFVVAAKLDTNGDGMAIQRVGGVAKVLPAHLAQAAAEINIATAEFVSYCLQYAITSLEASDDD